MLTFNGQGVVKSDLGLQKYTPEQVKMINQQRQAWNNNERRIAEQSGIKPNVYVDNSLVGNASVLPKDAWGQWAAEGIAVRRSMIGVHEFLASRTSRGVDIGLIVDHFAQYSDNSEKVNVSMDGISRAKTDQGLIQYQGTPIAIIDNSISYGWRQWATMQRAGGSAMRDAAMVAKNRYVMEKQEDFALNGITDNDGNLIKVGGAEAYGLLNHPQRNTFAHGITINGASPKEIKDAIVGTLKAAHADNFKSGFTVMMNWDDYFYMQTYQDSMATAEGSPTATGADRRTIAQEVLNIPGVDNIVAFDSIPANTIIAMVVDREVCEVLNAMPLTQIAKFRANTTDNYTFECMQAQALQLKFDYNNQMGLAVGTEA